MEKINYVLENRKTEEYGYLNSISGVLWALGVCQRKSGCEESEKFLSVARIFPPDYIRIIMHISGGALRKIQQRHIEIRTHIAKEAVEDEVQLQYCRAEDIVAGILIKQLESNRYTKLQLLLGVHAEESKL